MEKKNKCGYEKYWLKKGTELNCKYEIWMLLMRAGVELYI